MYGKNVFVHKASKACHVITRRFKLVDFDSYTPHNKLPFAKFARLFFFGSALQMMEWFFGQQGKQQHANDVQFVSSLKIYTKQIVVYFWSIFHSMCAVITLFVPFTSTFKTEHWPFARFPHTHLVLPQIICRMHFCT